MRLALLALLAGCPSSHTPSGDGGDVGPDAFRPSLGAHWHGDGVDFRLASTRATRIELSLYAAPTGAAPVLSTPMTRGDDGVWSARVESGELPETIYYGYRVWGPNWDFDAAWQPGSTAGWITDVDTMGNRMNPNKLVFDPYGLELSHDPTTPTQPSGQPYSTGNNRAIDSGPVAPKSIVLREEAPDPGTKPPRALADEIIYEVHLRGLTQADPAAGACAGTYAGAATRAAYLADLGITAVEFLPVHETQNDRNDVEASTKGDNYWGYSTLSFFAPDRRYACDRSPGGPTREFREMVKTFHAHGIEVYIDVVYNHTAEGGGGSLLSWRGIDNAGYYQLDRAGTGFTNSNGVGADLAGDKPLVEGIVLDSLRYWTDTLGVDGYRFDLAPVLGNTCGPSCFKFSPDGLPLAIARELGDRAKLIAEPWAVTNGGYQVGKFPAPWTEWNDKFRDTIRQAQNQTGVTPGWLANRMSGSPDLFKHDGRTPDAGISYLVSHDGFTLHDLYACNGSNNAQAWPAGPSDGGTNDNKSWDHGGDMAARRTAVRTGLALQLLAAGVPMITGGDELGRSTRCNNNPYNLDSPVSWLDWSKQDPALWTFAQRLFAFRTAHAALRPTRWRSSSEVTWLDGFAGVAAGGYMDDATKAVLAWKLDGAAFGDIAAAIYVAYNRGAAGVTVTLPAPPAGLAWYRSADTGPGLEPNNFAAAGSEYRMQQAQYGLGARSLAIFVAR
ncbi:MAG: glycogen-debranching protein [Deltaproteobacteria bacterium]|nr:glycogen-debranching protein [Deltaproteobacteria bacterium]